jgi:hypothetical protein
MENFGSRTPLRQLASRVAHSQAGTPSRKNDQPRDVLPVRDADSTIRHVIDRRAMAYRSALIPLKRTRKRSRAPGLLGVHASYRTFLAQRTSSDGATSHTRRQFFARRIGQALLNRVCPLNTLLSSFRKRDRTCVAGFGCICRGILCADLCGAPLSPRGFPSCVNFDSSRLIGLCSDGVKYERAIRAARVRRACGNVNRSRATNFSELSARARYGS